MKDITIEKAKRLRQEMTLAEKSLWACLRAKKLCGYKFRRQHTMPPYIVDFCCIEKRLIIELDGGGHRGQHDYDQLRSGHFSTQNYRVLRFWNHDIFHNREWVLNTIRQELE